MPVQTTAFYRDSPQMKERVIMACIHCASENVKRYGKDRRGNQRFICGDCRKVWADLPVRPLGNMRIPLAKAIDCLKLLMDGMSIRAVERFTGIDKNTICDLVVTVGEQCQRFLEKTLQNIRVYNFEDAREGAIVRLESAEPRRSGIVDWTVQNVISNDEFVAVPNVAFQVYRKTGTAVTKIETGEIPVCFRHMGTQDFVDGKRLPIEGAFWIAARAKRGGRTLFVLEPIDAGEAGAPLHDDDDPPPKKKGDQKKSAPKVNRGGSKPAF